MKSLTQHCHPSASEWDGEETGCPFPARQALNPLEVAVEIQGPELPPWSVHILWTPRASKGSWGTQQWGTARQGQRGQYTQGPTPAGERQGRGCCQRAARVQHGYGSIAHRQLHPCWPTPMGRRLTGPSSSGTLCPCRLPCTRNSKVREDSANPYTDSGLDFASGCGLCRAFPASFPLLCPSTTGDRPFSTEEEGNFIARGSNRTQVSLQLGDGCTGGVELMLDAAHRPQGSTVHIRGHACH